MKQLRTIRTGTKHKYYRVIQDCHMQQSFDLNEMRVKHKVGRVLFQAMIDANVINLHRHQCKWISGPITDALLREIYAQYETIKKRHQASFLLKHSNSAKKETTIKAIPIPAPIKIEIPAPSPIEKVHVDTSIADNTIDVSYKYAFITGMLMGALIISVIAYLW
jgi:hypothetical protein